MVKLTKEDKNYITLSAKMIPYPVDLEFGHISVPVGQEKEAWENLTVRHLINKFDLKIQTAISVELNKVYDPKLRSKPVELEKEKECFVRPKKGEIWLDSCDNSRKYFDWVKEGKYRVKFLNELRPGRTFIEQEIINSLKNGCLKIEVK